MFPKPHKDDNAARAAFIGAWAARAGDSIDANPYRDPALRSAWEQGFEEFYEMPGAL